MNTPNITAKDIGNGNKKEIVRLIPKDIPSQTNWLSKYCLLFILTHTHQNFCCCIVVKRIIQIPSKSVL